MSYEIVPSLAFGCDYETCNDRSNERICQVCRDRLAMAWALKNLIREDAIDELMGTMKEGERDQSDAGAEAGG